MRRVAAVFLVATSLSVSISAWAAERLAVLELSGDLPAQELGLLTDEVRGAVVRGLGARIHVMTRENMEVMLTDMGIDASCVSEGACEVETARNLGVDYVVSGAVVGMGGKQIASLKLHRTQNAQLLASERAQGADALGLLDAIGGTANELIAVLSSPAPSEVATVQSIRQPDSTPPAAPSHDPDFIGLEVTGELSSPALGKLVCISPGSFTMGSPPTAETPARLASGPLHRVTLTHGFCVMEREVTQGAWKSTDIKDRSWFAKCGDDCPANYMNWYDAVTFANKRSAAEGLTLAYRIEGKSQSMKCTRQQAPDCFTATLIPGADGYRLLTEAEWEVAARGREALAFSGSNSAESVGWVAQNSDKKVHATCEMQRNGYGLCDMIGNVSEWTWDYYNELVEAPTVDPTGPNFWGFHVMRGGSFKGGPWQVGYRHAAQTDHRFEHYGTRLARPAPE